MRFLPRLILNLNNLIKILDFNFQLRYPAIKFLGHPPLLIILMFKETIISINFPLLLFPHSNQFPTVLITIAQSILLSLKLIYLDFVLAVLLNQNTLLLIYIVPLDYLPFVVLVQSLMF